MIGKEPKVCAFCKKIIYDDKDCFELHEKEYYHADCLSNK